MKRLTAITALVLLLLAAPFFIRNTIEVFIAAWTLDLSTPLQWQLHIFLLAGTAVTVNGLAKLIRDLGRTARAKKQWSEWI